MSELPKTLALCSLVGALAAAITSAPAGAVSPGSGPAKIAANPSILMINTDTTLTGSGFPAHTKVALEECGKTRWVVPANPCNSGNGQTVETNAKGRFSTSFEVQLCPEGAPGEFPTSRVCYIGARRFGIDTGMLEPAATVTVTYP